jgi:hypothetical protein
MPAPARRPDFWEIVARIAAIVTIVSFVLVLIGGQ